MIDYSQQLEQDVILKYFEINIKCAEELTGRNSVTPCTIDNNTSSAIV